MSTTYSSRILRFGAAVALALVVALWLGLPMLAFAHARLVRSQPTAGAVLDSSPGKVDLWFSESASLQFTTIKLLDRSHKEYPVGAPSEDSGDKTHVTATLPTDLAPATYTIIWRTLSATDGHVTTGNLAFKIRGASSSAGSTGGTTTEDNSPPQADESTAVEGTAESQDPLRWLVRAVMLASAALLAGGSIFSGFIVRPVASGTAAYEKLLPSLRRSFGGLGAIAAGLLLVALALDLALQVGSIGGGGLGEGLANLGLAGTLLTTTGYGYAWIVKVVAAVLLLGAMLVSWRGRSGSLALGVWSLAGMSGLALAFGEALSSHAAAAATAPAEGNTQLLSGGFLPIPMLSDWVHLATAFTWIGGVGYFALVLYPGFRRAGLGADEQRAFLATAVPRFSRLAIASVAVLGTTGLYNLLARTTDLGAILGSTYGQVLAIKIGLFIVLVAIGAINVLRLTPGLQGRRQGDVVSGLRRSTRTEAFIACGAFLCAAGLSLLPPPSGPGSAYSASPPTTAVAQATPSGPESTPTPQPPLTATSSQSVSGYKLSIDVNSSFEGDVFTATIAQEDPAAPPLTDVQKVLFKITPQDVDAGSSSITAQRQGDAAAAKQTWTANETVFTLDGTYLVTVIAQRTQAHDLKAAFRFDLAEGSGLKARPSQVLEVHLDTDPSPPISGTATLKIALVDGAGAPVSDANISVSPLMPAHGHIEPTANASPVAGQPGMYTMPVHFSMGGAWLILFNVERPGQGAIKVDAGLDVVDPNATPTPGGT